MNYFYTSLLIIIAIISPHMVAMENEPSICGAIHALANSSNIHHDDIKMFKRNGEYILGYEHFFNQRVKYQKLHPNDIMTVKNTQLCTLLDDLSKHVDKPHTNEHGLWVHFCLVLDYNQGNNTTKYEKYVHEGWTEEQGRYRGSHHEIEKTIDEEIVQKGHTALKLFLEECKKFKEKK